MTDPYCRSWLTVVPDANGDYFIRFNSPLSLTYLLQRATDATGPWNTLDKQTAPASGLVEYDDTNPPIGQAFYRTLQP